MTEIYEAFVKIPLKDMQKLYADVCIYVCMCLRIIWDCRDSIFIFLFNVAILCTCAALRRVTAPFSLQLVLLKKNVIHCGDRSGVTTKICVL